MSHKRTLPSDRSRRGRISHRRAFVLAATIAALLVVMLFSRSVVVGLVARQKSVNTDVEQLQCLFIVEAGAAKARRQLRNDRQYRGEVWRLDCNSSHGTVPGAATIQVTPLDGQPEAVRVKVVGRYPDDPIHRIQREKEFVVHLRQPGAGT